VPKAPLPSVSACSCGGHGLLHFDVPHHLITPVRRCHRRLIVGSQNKARRPESLFLLGDDEMMPCSLGPALTDATVARLGFEDLQPVLDRLAAQTVPPDAEVLVVPPGKIEANALTESEETLLRSGMRKAPLVAQFLSKWHDETLGERLAEAFRTEYARLRRERRDTEVFGRLQSWAGGPGMGSPEHQVAVLAVMAYFFERCDIFEAPRSAP